MTSPVSIGSEPLMKTIGIVAVAAFAACAAGSRAAAIATGWRRTRSAASAGNRSYFPSAQRSSILMFRPSTNPLSCRPRRNSFKLTAFEPNVP